MPLFIDALIALATGFGLWAVLPRGVVLVKSRLTHNPDGQPLYDTWRIQNDSALPVRIVSASYRGTDTFRGDKWVWVAVDDAVDERRLWLHLEDEVPEIRRLDAGVSWSNIVVPPGDTLRAMVPNNTDLRIKYRRAGLFGFAERREVLLSGGV